MCSVRLADTAPHYLDGDMLYTAPLSTTIRLADTTTVRLADTAPHYLDGDTIHTALDTPLTHAI